MNYQKVRAETGAKLAEVLDHVYMDARNPERYAIEIGIWDANDGSVYATLVYREKPGGYAETVAGEPSYGSETVDDAVIALHADLKSVVWK